MCLILPINFSGAFEGDERSFGHTTISNLSPKYVPSVFTFNLLRDQLQISSNLAKFQSIGYFYIA